MIYDTNVCPFQGPVGGERDLYTISTSKDQFTTMWFLLALLAQAYAAIPPTCDSQVYCQGPLLDTVQMARIYNDSKTFVDMKIKTSESDVLSKYKTLMDQSNNSPSFDQVKKFVNDNFEDGKELEDWVPPDFIEEPAFLQNVKDPELKAFGKSIVALWKILARKMKPDVAQNPQQYSQMPLPNGFIIPGGRFKEIYYWDTYWIIRGLLISDMKDTARGMIENLMFLVKKLGHVPNGSRVYYTQRSQPPLLTRMVRMYMEYTQDYDWLKEHIDILDQELNYWINNRVALVKKNGITYRMFQYNAASKGPRPESYREDVATAKQAKDPQDMYLQLKSGAESGWDFSSRWIVDNNGNNNANLSYIKTTQIIPVDLNAFMYDAFVTLGKLYSSIQRYDKAATWLMQANIQVGVINSILWDEKEGMWFDYDKKLNKFRKYFYVSNLAPLFAELPRISNVAIKKVLAYIERNGITSYKGGTPTSIIRSGEQWDYPNAWPPLQSILIYGLKNTRNKAAEQLAFSFAQTWITANLIGFKETKEMFEKYDAENPGKYGGGGEYVVQAGFGWTNGVVLELLDTYGKFLKANN